MIFLLIFLLLAVSHVHCSIGTSEDEHTPPEMNERKEPTGERTNQLVHIISKENQTHSLMESFALRNRTVLISRETGKAENENEDSDVHELSIIFSNDAARHEDNYSNSTEIIQVSMASTQNYSFGDIFFSIINNTQRIVSYHSSSEAEDTKQERDIHETADDKRVIVIKIEVRKKSIMKPKILNEQKLNVTTTINALKTISENKKFNKILNTPIYYGDFEIVYT